MEQNLTIKVPNTENDQRVILEQYKMLVDSINKLNETRQNSNNLWMGANAAGLSALAYLRDSNSISQHYKPFLLLTVITLGLFFCISWLSYLWTIKKSLEVRNDLLIELEKNFAVPIFSKAFFVSDKKSVRASLTTKEMMVPLLFLASYLFFILLLFFFTQEVIAS